MSIGPMIGIPASVAGVPIAQAYGPELDRTLIATQKQLRRQYFERLAERAAGIGQAQADQETSDRGSGNRQEWEYFLPAHPQSASSAHPLSAGDARTGVHLDLTA